MIFAVDKDNKKIKIERKFNGVISKVWSAWTESEILEQWWAPKPWKAETKVMNFIEGGHWLYAMVSPEGEKHWGRADYISINHLKQIIGKDVFCDENGVVNESLPVADWKTEFTDLKDSTLVNIETTYKELSEIEKIIEMGFKEGITSAMDYLDNLLKNNSL